MAEVDVADAVRAARELAHTIESLAASGALGPDEVSWLRIAALDRLLELERSGALELAEEHGHTRSRHSYQRVV